MITPTETASVDETHGTLSEGATDDTDFDDIVAIVQQRRQKVCATADARHRYRHYEN